jgi:hypothetical protein
MLNLKKNNGAFLKKFSLCCALMTSSHIGHAQDRTGLKTSVAVDLVGEFAGNSESEAVDQFLPRSIDLMLYAPIDHLFDGTLSVAAHQEDGAALVELHESYVSSDRLIPGLKFRLGQFFLGIGRLNRYHQHEWPFVSTPIVQSRFFDKEGLIDSGLEVSYLLPLPFYLDLTVGATNGFVYGHSHDAGEKPKTPTQYLHLLSFVEFDGFDLQPGLSLLNRQAADGSKLGLTGLDLTGKNRAGKILRFLWQSEIWQRIFEPKDGKQEISTGAYLYPQYGFDSGAEFGIRFDYLTVNTKKDATGKKVANSESALVPTLGYRPSEFSLWRLAYRMEKIESEGSDSIENQVLEVQATYILGAHPAHDF